MSIASFFGTQFWGSRWGVVDAFHRTPHKGLDVVHAGRTPVPVLRSGRVVADLPSSSVGRYIVVEVGPSDYDVYCHVVTRGLKGQVSAGTIIAYLAGYSDPHGSAWTGPHCHVCRSTTRTGWAYWGPQNRNPEPLIRSVIAGGVPGSSSIFLIKEDDVRVLQTPNGQNYYAGELTCFTIGVDAANALIRSGMPLVKVSSTDLSRVAAAANSANDKLFAELVQKIVAALPSLGGGSATTPTAIADETRKQLLPDFAAIPAAVITEMKKPGN